MPEERQAPRLALSDEPPTPRLLVIGERERAASLLAQLPWALCQATDVAEDGAEGCALARRACYDAIILYMTARRFQALDDCRTLRAAGVTAAILVLGSDATPTDVIAALGAGADAYLAGTVEPAELRARLMALLRRQPNATIAH